jgi:hypothetical protein
MLLKNPNTTYSYTVSANHDIQVVEQRLSPLVIAARKVFKMQQSALLLLLYSKLELCDSTK